METNKEHAMTAKEIAAELEKLIAAEKAEPMAGEEQDVKDLEDALALVEKFVSEEEAEMPEVPEKPEATVPGKPVDTSVLTGPINGLKNFLIKKSQDNDRQV